MLRTEGTANLIVNNELHVLGIMLPISEQPELETDLQRDELMREGCVKLPSGGLLRVRYKCSFCKMKVGTENDLRKHWKETHHKCT